MDVKTFISLVKETFQDWSEDKAPRLAAALAYYTIFSIAPLLFLVIVITGIVIGNNQEVQQQLFAQISNLAGQGAADQIEGLVNQQFSNTGSNIFATLIGIVTLIFGATGVFGQLQDALNTIWEVEPKKGGGIMGMVKGRFLSFTMILGVSFILLVSLVVSASVSALGTFLQNNLPGGEFLWQVVNFLISTAIITLIFAMIFKILPDVEIAWKDVWLGALITALLFNLGKFLIGLYIGRSAVTSAYGAAGSLIVILLWVYYSAQILFLGAEFTQVYARRRGSRIVPSENAQRIDEGARIRQGARPRTTAQQAPGPALVSSAPRVEEVMIPIAGQPVLHAQAKTTPPRERIRYEPANPASVLPVIAAGAVAGAFTLARVANRAYRRVSGQEPSTRQGFRRVYYRRTQQQ